MTAGLSAALGAVCALLAWFLEERVLRRDLGFFQRTAVAIGIFLLIYGAVE